MRQPYRQRWLPPAEPTPLREWKDFLDPTRVLLVLCHVLIIGSAIGLAIGLDVLVKPIVAWIVSMSFGMVLLWLLERAREKR